jgi:hypothetical protein
VNSQKELELSVSNWTGIALPSEAPRASALGILAKASENNFQSNSRFLLKDRPSLRTVKNPQALVGILLKGI